MKFGISGRYTRYIPYVVCLFAAAVLIVVMSGGLFEAPPSAVRDSDQHPDTEPPSWLAVSGDSPASLPVHGQDLLAFQDHLSEQVASILSEVKGAGTVQVRIMLEWGPTFTYHEDARGSDSDTREEDSEGGTREIVERQRETALSVLRGAGGAEEPVITRVDSGQIRGVLVVAEGASDPRVKAELTSAVATLLDISSHRVIVLAGKEGS